MNWFGKEGDKMPKVAKIEQQKKNAQRFNLYFERNGQAEFAFGVSDDTIVHFNLAKGKEISEEEIATILFDDEVNKAFQSAMNTISYRMRSGLEVRTHLREREYTSDVIDAVVEKLLRLGYLDDLKFAQFYVRNEMNITRKGPVIIQNELKNRGVSIEFQETAMFEYPTELRVGNALKWAEKTLAKQKTASRTAEQKTIQLLIRKGFSLEMAKQAVNQVESQGESDEWHHLCADGYKQHRKFQAYEDTEYKQKMTASLFRKGYPYELISQFVRHGKNVIGDRDVGEI